MAAFIRKDNFEAAAKLGVMDCVSCGSCSWLCPSHIPLVHYFNYAKGMINDQERERRKIEQTRMLAEAHALRVEKAAAEKAAFLAAKKAQAAAASATKEKDGTPA
jgi:electron transport complex protein RnfC